VVLAQLERPSSARAASLAQQALLAAPVIRRLRLYRSLAEVAVLGAAAAAECICWCSHSHHHYEWRHRLYVSTYNFFLWSRHRRFSNSRNHRSRQNNRCYNHQSGSGYTVTPSVTISGTGDWRYSASRVGARWRCICHCCEWRKRLHHNTADHVQRWWRSGATGTVVLSPTSISATT
jgi:hypothetical protein